MSLASSENVEIDAFLRFLTTERRLSLRTVDMHRRALYDLAALAAPRALGALEAPDLRRALGQMRTRGWAARTLAITLSAWRGYYRWRVRTHGARVDPTTDLRAPKAPSLLPKALTPDAATRLMRVDATTPLAACDRAMFELMYSSGLRLAELVGLDRIPSGASAGWLSDACDEVVVTGKGRKQRIVPVGSHAASAIRAWLAVRAEIAATDEPALFVGARGKRISPRVVQRRLAAHAVSMGLDVRVHPHVLRHSFASHLLQSAGDLRAVQELLGHASISTTQIYTRLDDQHLARAYDAAHPRARKKTPTPG